MLTDLPGGRRQLRMQVGAYSIVVTEVPATSLTDREWHDIQLARRSYTTMWSGADSDVIANDPADGRSEGVYDTSHYLAWVRDLDGPAKLVTMRKVALVPTRLTAAQRSDPGELLPVDVRFWSVRDRNGAATPLWDVLKTHARQLAPNDRTAEFRTAAIGRTGTFPYGEREATLMKRWRTAVAFAAIQILATCGDPSLLYVCSLCSGFADRVLCVVDVNGNRVAPGHTPTEAVLGLPPGSVVLDNDLSLVQEHKSGFPGYFIDNADAARLLAGLLDDGLLTVVDLGAPIVRLVEQEGLESRNTRRLEDLLIALARRDHRRLAELLTRPDLFKYLIPLIAGNERLAKMSAAEFRARLLFGTADGPFSSTLVPSAWAASAWRVLDAVASCWA